MEILEERSRILEPRGEAEITVELRELVPQLLQVRPDGRRVGLARPGSARAAALRAAAPGRFQACPLARRCGLRGSAAVGAARRPARCRVARVAAPTRFARAACCSLGSCVVVRD